MTDPVLYAWPSPSSRGVTVYETLLRRDGTMSCDCPGWINAKRGKPRSCRHVVERQREAIQILTDFKAGRPIPARRTIGFPTPPTSTRALANESDLIGVLEL